MDAVTIILAVSPVIIVLICAWLLRMPADFSALAGLVAAVLIAATHFQTEASIVGKSIIIGILWSLPIALFIAASMLQALFMERVGALRRISIFLKSFSARDKAAQVIIINIGITAALIGFGVNPLSILPLLLIGIGTTTYAAIALPAVGTAALFIYAFLGMTVSTFALHLGGGQTFDQAGAFIVPYLWPATFVITLGLLYIQGGLRLVGRGVLHALITATVVWGIASLASGFRATHMTGILAGIGVVIVMCVWTRIQGNRIIDRSVLTSEDKADEKQILLPVAMLPLFLTALFTLLILLVPTIKDFLKDIVSIPVRIFFTHQFRFYVVWHLYFWILIATLISMLFFKSGLRAFRESLAIWARRAPRPTISIILFTATAFVMMYSGFVEESVAHYKALVLPDGNLNMIHVIQDFCASTFGTLYPFFGTVAGLRVGFISGSAALPISVLTRTHLEIAEELFKPGGAGIFIAAASALAASLSLMINPAWLMNASAVIGKPGYESRALRSTIIIAFITVIILGLFTLVLVK